MKNILVKIIYLHSFIVFSQNSTNNERFLFENQLTQIHHSDSIAKHTQILKEISISSSIDSISTNSKWQLMYLHQTGWEEYLPSASRTINSLYIGKEKNVVSTQEILKVFEWNKQNKILLDKFPAEFSLQPRGAPLNGKWTIVFLKNDCITLQYVHSYPNGNQSSWYRRTNYYFKKIN